MSRNVMSRNVMSRNNLEQLHQRIPGLREMMYGKDKAMYAPASLSPNLRRQTLLKEIRTLANEKAEEYLKFTRDIRAYDFTKPISTEILDNLDFEDIGESVMKYGTYLCYDDALMVGSQLYKVYLINFKKKHFVCIYKFGRYYDNTLKHPGTKLLFAIPFRP